MGTSISESTKIIDIVDTILTIFVIIFALLSVYLVNENNKLLIQVDEAMGKYNEVSYQVEIINNAYDDLRKDYESLVDYIRTSSKYEMPESEKMKGE